MRQAEVHITALEQDISVDRIIGHVNNEPGPIAVFTAGLHGNEPAGICALNTVFYKIERLNLPIRGELIGIAGNLAALSKGVRFIDMDLNRMWTPDKVGASMKEKGKGSISEMKEVYEINRLLDSIFERAKPERAFFYDLHTTSSITQPYSILENLPMNREIADHIPAYNVIGSEKALVGTFPSYINDRGHAGITFESGQHDSMSAIENHEAAIWVAMVASGLIHKDQVPRFRTYRETLFKSITEGRRNLRVVYRYGIGPDEHFVMEPGYVNFQKVEEGEHLARNNKGPIRSPMDGRIYMPLYQSQGNDGFFIVQETDAKGNLLDEGLHVSKAVKEAV